MATVSLELYFNFQKRDFKESQVSFYLVKDCTAEHLEVFLKE